MKIKKLLIISSTLLPLFILTSCKENFDSNYGEKIEDSSLANTKLEEILDNFDKWTDSFKTNSYEITLDTKIEENDDKYKSRLTIKFDSEKNIATQVLDIDYSSTDSDTSGYSYQYEDGYLFDTRSKKYEESYVSPYTACILSVYLAQASFTDYATTSSIYLKEEKDKIVFTMETEDEVFQLIQKENEAYFFSKSLESDKVYDISICYKRKEQNLDYQNKDDYEFTNDILA